MGQRKNFSYMTASVQDIISHFKASSRQAINAARKAHPSGSIISVKIEEAYYLYKLEQLQSKLSRG